MRSIKTKSALAMAIALVAGTAACSPQTADQPQATEQAEASASAAQDAMASPIADPSVAPVKALAPDKAVLRLEGLGDLKIGDPIPKGSDFAARGVQASEGCTTISSPDYVGVYGLVEGGAVRRITVSGKSPVKLVEGIGVGSSEADVTKAFPGFKSEPHKYVAAPAKYLTQPGNDPRLRFEIGADRKVTDIHVGTTPQLEYVEGCA